MEYDSAFKNKELLPSAMTPSRTLCSVNKASHRRINTAQLHLHKESEIVKLLEAEDRMVVAGEWDL